MRIESHGLAVDLPDGWDGRIFARHHAARPSGGGTAERRTATLHAGNFMLPRQDGDFGSTATSAMGAGGVFVALTEYVADDRLVPGRGLFAARGLPREISREMLSHRTLLVQIAGQVGLQRFFTAGGRPFCLYVVLGSDSESQVAAARQLIGGLHVETRR